MNFKVLSYYFEKAFTVAESFYGKAKLFINDSIFLKNPFLSYSESYFLLTLSPSDIHYQIIDNDVILEEDSFYHEDINELHAILNEYKNLSVFLILKDWDITIKHLDLKDASWFNKYLIRQEFQKGEFKDKELFYVKPSSIVSGLYRFISLNQNYALDHALINLACMKNTLIGVDIYEYRLLQNVVIKQSIQTTMPDWHMLLICEDHIWKMIVGYKKDLILVRFGHMPSDDPLFDLESYFLKEIVETNKYLRRLGLSQDSKIAFYADPKTFKRQSLSDYQMVIFDIGIIQNLTMKPPGVFDSIYACLKTFLRLDFYKSKMSVPYFFWHHLFFKLPQYIINILTPALIFTCMFCLTYGIKLSYYHHAISNIDHQMEKVSPLKKIEEEEHGKSKQLSFFKQCYKKNPIIIIKQISDCLGSTLTGHAVNWVAENDRLKIVLTLKEKTKSHKKEHLKEIKEKIEKTLHVKIPSFTPQWQEGQKNSIVLTLVGPS